MGVFMEFNNIIKISSVYIGVILGAGFLSGQEILNFFAIYGYMGLIGCVLSGLVFTLVGYKVLLICKENSITGIKDFLVTILGKHIGSIAEIFVAVFMLILFSAMLAGSGASIMQNFHVEYTYGVILTGSISFVVFLFDLRGLVKVNTILSPIMVIGAISIGIYSIIFREQAVFNQEDTISFLFRNWIVGATIYVSYNSATGIGVLTTITPLITNKSVAKYSSVISGIIMGILAFLIALTLLINDNLVKTEIPIMEILKNHSEFIRYSYFLILMMAIFTTAIGNGFAFIKWLEARHNLPPLWIKIGVVMLGIVLAQFGFSNIVGKVYPLFGIIGLIEIIAIIKYKSGL